MEKKFKYRTFFYLLIFFIIVLNQSAIADQLNINKNWLSLNKSGMQSHRLEKFEEAEKFYLLAITEAELIDAKKEFIWVSINENDF